MEYKALKDQIAQGQTKGIQANLPASIHEALEQYQAAFKAAFGEQLNKEEVLVRLAAHGLEGLAQEVTKLEEERAERLRLEQQAKERAAAVRAGIV